MQKNSEQKQSWFKNTLFCKTLQYCRQKPSYLFLTMIYDIVFVLGLYILNKLFTYIFPPKFSAPTTGFMIVLLVMALLFSLIYSLAKYVILSIIDSFAKPLQLKLENFGFFYLFNTISLIITTLFLLTIDVFIKTYIKPDFIATMQYVLFIPVIIVLYFILSVVHSNFIKKRSMKSALKQTISSFSRLQTYKPIFNAVIVNIVLLLFLFLFVYIIDKTYLSKLQDINLYISISFFLFIILVIVN